MPLSRITQKQILARVTLNGTDGTAADAGDFIVQSTSADEDDNILLEESTDFAYDMTHDEKKERVERSVGYLKYQKTFTDWTSEDFTVIDKAITDADAFTS